MTCLRGCILLLYYFRENLIRFHQKEARVSSFERNRGFSIKILSKNSKYHAMPSQVPQPTQEVTFMAFGTFAKNQDLDGKSLIPLKA